MTLPVKYVNQIHLVPFGGALRGLGLSIIIRLMAPSQLASIYPFVCCLSSVVCRLFQFVKLQIWLLSMFHLGIENISFFFVFFVGGVGGWEGEGVVQSMHWPNYCDSSFLVIALTLLAFLAFFQSYIELKSVAAHCLPIPK